MHFLAQFGNVKKQTSKVPFNKPQNCIYDVFTRSWKNSDLMFSFAMASTRRGHLLGANKSAKGCPVDTRGDYLSNAHIHRSHRSKWGLLMCNYGIMARIFMYQATGHSCS